MPIFDDYLVCDWSAANSPKLGKDSIWIAMAARDGATTAVAEPVNVNTRARAMDIVRGACLRAVATGRRLFAGFDFAFGYPAGTADAIARGGGWRGMWQAIGGLIRDDERNASNRFDVAAFLNRSCFAGAGGPFWGHPPRRSYDGLAPKKPAAMPDGIEEMRMAEAIVGGQPVWKLAYTGAVGSQTLLGIARLGQLLNDTALEGRIAVWPFETGFAQDFARPVTLAEIYPSAFTVKPRDGEVRDAAQVRTLAGLFARLDAREAFSVLLSPPPGLTEEDTKTVLAEEGWIVGAGHACNGLGEA